MPAPAHRQGFTLLEIIIVLLIIGLSAGMVQFSVSNRNARITVDQTAEQLQALLVFASDYALIHQQAMGVTINPTGYELKAFDERSHTWKNISTASATMKLDEHIRLMPERASAIITAFPDTNNQLPFVVVYPDGSLSPFSVIMEWQDDPESRLVMQLIGTDVMAITNSRVAP